jgi:hypothetical protein
MAHDRTCYVCSHYALCFARVKFDKAIHESLRLFDVDSPRGASPITPGHWQDIYEALAGACTCYAYEEDEG